MIERIASGGGHLSVCADLAWRNGKNDPAKRPIAIFVWSRCIVQESSFRLLDRELIESQRASCWLSRLFVHIHAFISGQAQTVISSTQNLATLSKEPIIVPLKLEQISLRLQTASKAREPPRKADHAMARYDN